MPCDPDRGADIPTPTHQQDEPTDEEEIPLSPRWQRTFWLLGGLVFLILGLVGVILPGLPTTPFLLLATACFARSSRRFYRMLLDNRWFGQGIRDYRAGKGVPRRIKVLAITMMAVFVLFAITVAIPSEHLWTRILVALAGLIGTIVVARLKTREEPNLGKTSKVDSTRDPASGH